LATTEFHTFSYLPYFPSSSQPFSSNPMPSVYLKLYLFPGLGPPTVPGAYRPLPGPGSWVLVLRCWGPKGRGYVWLQSRYLVSTIQ
jgi:hypothetical protein